MSLAIVHTRAQLGVDAPPVTVEVHLTRGLPSLAIVGLPETAVKESKDRVRSAIINNHFEFPLKRITINLAPADLPKEGGRYDLPIAIGILAASGQIPKESLNDYEFLGELALSGELRPVRGVLPAAKAVRDSGRNLLVPHSNADEGALVRDIHLFAAEHLQQVCTHLCNDETLPNITLAKPQQASLDLADLSDVHGQYLAKRALEIAAAGGHCLLMIGPPGTGKTMLAERLPGILPPMTEEQALESAAVKSISSQGFSADDWLLRPIRSPHHTASAIALVGGGSYPRPGEISLAHHGVLFLDELPEFDRRVLEVLREPLESGRITISRAAQQAEFPAEFQLIAAMNPCPCGYLGDKSGRCHCTEDQISRYRNRISGPLVDRIDLHVEVPNITHELLDNEHPQKPEASETVRSRVITARNKQLQRCGKSNAKLPNSEVEQYCQVDTSTKQLLRDAIDRLGLSTRGYHRILKVARTIADLEQSDDISAKHVSEAIGYRCLDRKPEY